MAQTSTLANLIVKISGNTAQLIGELNKAESRTDRFSKNVTKNLKRGALGAGIALAGIGIASIKMAADFDKSVREVRTLLPSLSDEGFNKLKADVLDFSNEVGIATSEVVPALYQAISAGIPPENALTFLKGASDLAIGGVTDLTSATDLLSSATNAFGKEAGTTGDIADSFFTAVKLGKTTVEEISASFSTAAPLAAAVGVSLDELLASVSAITLSGAPTAQAFTQIRAALLSLQRATPDMQKALEGMGFATGQAALDALGLQGTLQGLRDSADATNTPLIKLTGRAEGMQAILALTGENARRAGDLLTQFGDKAGASAAAAAVMNESTSRLFETFKTNLNNALITLGEEILPTVNKVLIELTSILPNVIQAVKDLAATAAEELGPAFDKALDAVEFWNNIIKLAEGDTSKFDDVLGFLANTLKDQTIGKLEQAAKDVENLADKLTVGAVDADFAAKAIERFGDKNLVAMRAGQAFADTLLREGIAFKEVMESAGNAARSIQAWHLANTVAEVSTEEAAEAVANLGVKAFLASRDLKTLESRALAAAIAADILRITTLSAGDELINFSTAQARAIQRQIGFLGTLVGTEGQLDKLTDSLLKAAGAFDDLGPASGGGGGVLDETVEKLGKFFDTGAIVFWAELSNQIREAQRAAEAFIGPEILTQFGDMSRGFLVLTEAEFDLLQIEKERATVLQRHLDLINAAGKAANVIGEGAIIRGGSGENRFQINPDGTIIRGGQDLIPGGAQPQGPNDVDIRKSDVQFNAPVTINAGSLDGEAMLASLEAAGVL